MNILKSLIKKDLLQLKSYKKSLIIFLLAYIFIAISQDSLKEISNMLIVMLTLGFGMFSIATFSYDEIAKADKFILTLPLTRREVVLSKYIFVICSTLLGCVLGMVLSFIITFVVTKSLPSIFDILSIGIGSIFGITLVESIQIPCIYKWGTERGKINMFILIILVAMVTGGITYIAVEHSIFSNLSDKIEKLIPIIILILISLMYFISYKVAYRIYSKKEV